jgi:hypothetical protein
LNLLELLKPSVMFLRRFVVDDGCSKVDDA